MKIISTEKEYTPIENAINSILMKNKTLPENVFKSPFRYFLFITFDELFMPIFFDRLKRYIENFREESFWLATIEPDPRTYYYLHFNFYGTFLFSRMDIVDDYLAALNNYPLNNPADALVHNSNRMIISSFMKSWAIYGSREDDIAICAFIDRLTLNFFKVIYGPDLLNEAETAAKYAYGLTKEHDFIKRFCENYHSR